MTSQPNAASSKGNFEQGNFHADLTAEADKVLLDPQLMASPTLSRLLKWLIAETIAGRGDRIKSYTIALDGLGRSEDFDSGIDGYARVQILRLKRALESHYAQLSPINELCLYLEQGSYRVNLGAVALAYPQLHQQPSSLEQAGELNITSPEVTHCPAKIALFPAVLLAASATILIFLAVLAAILLATEIDPLTYETVKHSLPGHEVSTLCPQPQRTVDDPWGLGSLLAVQNCG